MKIIGICRKCSLLWCSDAFISSQHPFLIKWTILLKDVLSLPDRWKIIGDDKMSLILDPDILIIVIFPCNKSFESPLQCNQVIFYWFSMTEPKQDRWKHPPWNGFPWTEDWQKVFYSDMMCTVHQLFLHTQDLYFHYDHLTKRNSWWTVHIISE